MKNILKITTFAFLIISFASCTDTIDPKVSPIVFGLRDISETTPPSILLSENDANTYNKMEWDKADFGIAYGLSAVSYKISVSDHDSDPNFLKTAEYSGKGISASPDRNSTLTVKEFNALINQLPTFKCGQQMNIDIRIKATLGSSGNPVVQYSSPITIAVTGYSAEKRKLSFAKEGQSPADAPKILSSNFDKENDYEGYMYLEPGDYKLYKPDACGSFSSPTVYGVGSGSSIVEGSSASSIVIAKAGYYLIKVNLSSTDTPAPGIKSLTYSAKYYKAFGIFGTAVINSTGPSKNYAVPMSDETNSNVWKITIELFKGNKFKFKANDWVGDLSSATTPPTVPPGSTTSIISFLGSSTTPNALTEVTTSTGDITVPGIFDGTKQKYDVVVNVSNPRNYTYTITPNLN